MSNLPKVRFISTGNIFELIGFINNKIIITFNNGQSIGTVPKEGYEPIGKYKGLDWEELEKQYSGYSKRIG